MGELARTSFPRSVARGHLNTKAAVLLSEIANARRVSSTRPFRSLHGPVPVYGCCERLLESRSRHFQSRWWCDCGFESPGSGRHGGYFLVFFRTRRWFSDINGGERRLYSFFFYRFPPHVTEENQRNIPRWLGQAASPIERSGRFCVRRGGTMGPTACVGRTNPGP